MYFCFHNNHLVKTSLGFNYPFVNFFSRKLRGTGFTPL
nr:MAG TPA: hypothetical protein [Caudoviricetes sp.]